MHTPTRAASAATRYAPPYPPSLPPSYPRTPPVAPYGGALMPPLPDPGFTRPHLVRHFSFTFAPHPVNAQFLPKTPYAWHGPPFTPPPPPHAQACEMAEAGESPAAAAGWL